MAAGFATIYILLLLLQIWDLASGKLKLSLTGHISTVRGVIVSGRSPYLFSCGEDKQVKCWDLEYNKVNINTMTVIEIFQHFKDCLMEHPILIKMYLSVSRLLGITMVT